MKIHIQVAILCFIAINLLAQPNNSSSKTDNNRADNTKTASALEHNGKSTAETDTPDQSSKRWYASSEWWLVIIAALTGITIAYQAREMSRATKVMERSTEATEKTVALLEKQATLMESQLEEMRDSTNVAINRDRGRVKILVMAPRFYIKQQDFEADFMVFRSSGTKVFRDELRVLFIKSENAEIVPEYSQCVQIPSNGQEILKVESAPRDGVRLRPDGRMNHEDTANIEAGKLFLHFYGFTRYRDIFKRRRRQNIHLRWSGNPEYGLNHWQWQPVGAPEENAEIEEQKAN